MECLRSLPYPLPLAYLPPPSDFSITWAGALQDTLRGHWCKASQITALGPGLQIRGCPRCPLTASKVAFVRGWLAGRSWGPPGAEINAASTWNRCTRWAREMRDAPPEPPPWGGPKRDTAIRRILAVEDARESHDDLPTVSHLAKSANPGIYMSLWELSSRRSHDEWLARRAARRRWLPSNGAEWRLPATAGRFHHAFHVLRLLLGGLRGEARSRSTSTRASAPWACSSCRSPEVRWALSTPCTDTGGVGWCTLCIPPRLLDFGFWAWSPAISSLTHVPGLPELVASIRADSAAHPEWSSFCWADSANFAPCPLCGHGEAGGEHLLCGCPTVAAAWLLLAPGAPPPF